MARRLRKIFSLKTCYQRPLICPKFSPSPSGHLDDNTQTVSRHVKFFFCRCVTSASINVVLSSKWAKIQFWVSCCFNCTLPIQLLFFAELFVYCTCINNPRHSAPPKNPQSLFANLEKTIEGFVLVACL